MDRKSTQINPRTSVHYRLKEGMRGILAVSITVVGILHFIKPNQFGQMIPSVLPYPLSLVYISGFFEILGSIGLLIPQFSVAAAWGLITLFIAVFPANINMAVNHIIIPGIPDSSLLYWLRLPFQGVLIAWAWWYTRDSRTLSHDHVNATDSARS